MSTAIAYTDESVLVRLLFVCLVALELASTILPDTVSRANINETRLITVLACIAFFIMFKCIVFLVLAFLCVHEKMCDHHYELVASYRNQ
jgi:phage shock protein PspC (stress-responsive transcriptional regulator)